MPFKDKKTITFGFVSLYFSYKLILRILKIWLQYTYIFFYVKLNMS